jgi:hypothetical protein
MTSAPFFLERIRQVGGNQPAPLNDQDHLSVKRSTLMQCSIAHAKAIEAYA